MNVIALIHKMLSIIDHSTLNSCRKQLNKIYYDAKRQVICSPCKKTTLVVKNLYQIRIRETKSMVLN